MLFRSGRLSCGADHADRAGDERRDGGNGGGSAVDRLPGKGHPAPRDPVFPPVSDGRPGRHGDGTGVPPCRYGEEVSGACVCGELLMEESRGLKGE